MAGWGSLAGGVVTHCTRHRNDFKDGLVVNFMVACEVVGCNRLAKWGVNGLQPTHCPIHGPRKRGLVRLLGSNGRKAAARAQPSHSRRGPSRRAKLEIIQ